MKKNIFGIYPALLQNITLSYLILFIGRLIFYFVNKSYFDINISDISMLLKGSLIFDTATACYINALYVIMTVFPLHIKEYSNGYNKIARIIFIVFNSIALIATICDTAYFPFTGRRTTPTVFSEFKNEDNLSGIFLKEAVNSWYLVLAIVILIFILVKLSKTSPLLIERKRFKDYISYYLLRIATLLLAAACVIFGVRGGLDRTTRPITIANANQFVSKPIECALVLNTPFSIIRTLGKKTFKDPQYFKNNEECYKYYSCIHNAPDDSTYNNAPGKGRNVVIIIVESFAKEYIGSLNKDLENGTYKGYTPFTDSLISQSLTFEYSYTNGRKSIDAMPSVLSSIPYFIEPFFLTPAAVNEIGGIAKELKREGYESAFFHGAPNGSMGFEAFAKSTGFEKYYGETEFDNDKRFNGEKDFDGHWAIWDEPFLQFYATKMNEMKQPFVTALFTASSHHPFNIPQQYKSKFSEEQLPIHKCIRYTDNALREFFNTAKKMPWFKNTIFVITNDHTNLSNHPEYQNDMGLYTGPVIFYAPGDSLITGRRKGIAQQIDIMPTILGYVGYKKPYIAFGTDLLSTPPDSTFSVSYCNGIYQYTKYGYFMQFDGNKVAAIYDINDKMLKNNIINKPDSKITEKMGKELKSLIQQYMIRMTTDSLTVR